MAENSKIEWCHHTFNPWRGCTKISPGCAHCYAETLSHRNPAVLGEWGKGRPRLKASAAMWRQPLKWNQEAHDLRYRKFTRPRVFCASLADWLDEEVPAAWLFDLISLILRTPSLDWLLLTKRPQNWRARLKAAADQCTCDPGDVTDRIYAWIEGSRMIHNIWMGTSVEDQTRADERIPLLLDIPARVRFLSCEPLLGPVRLDQYRCGETRHEGGHFILFGDALTGFRATSGWSGKDAGPRIHWVIAGGESGPDARPMHPDWARSLRDQCAAAGVPFFFKQWGEYRAADTIHAAPDLIKAAQNRTPPSRQTEGSPLAFWNVGKKKAGRLLDGVIHDAFPE